MIVLGEFLELSQIFSSWYMERRRDILFPSFNVLRSVGLWSSPLPGPSVGPRPGALLLNHNSGNPSSFSGRFASPLLCWYCNHGAVEMSARRGVTD